ncbi:hypothetical protein DSO57_1024117 [Entomophthora muscae]|uniref:Uncharacterized protein n=1 Tax=Entomophthora muscae TaxID=34485 RepID=A0ACC2U0I5_9FUNG|nr:hypothetical protein DSO57_1024117 [Entomophthora muscae]
MDPPVTLRPDRPQEAVIVNESTSTQLFGIRYIVLPGLVDSMVLTDGPWALLGKLFPYIVKLAPILWWACLSGLVGCLPASFSEPAAGWLPETSVPSSYQKCCFQPNLSQRGWAAPG